MKLNQFTDIGIRALIYLAQSSTEPLFTIEKMAKDLQVSRNHLVKVIHFMAKQQWLTTSRGKGGGVKLTHPLAHYSIGHLIKTLQTHNAVSAHLVNCDAPECVLRASCSLPYLLDQALSQFYQFLNQYTLQDILRRPMASPTISAHQLIDILAIS